MLKWFKILLKIILYLPLLPIIGMPGTGGNIEVYIGEQTAKGTRATDVLKLRKTSWDGSPNYVKKESPELTGSRAKGQSWVSEMNASGSYSFMMTRDQLVKHLPFLGMEITGTVTTVDTWEMAASTTKWATIAIYHTDTDTDFYEVFIDARINTLKFTLVGASEIMVDINFEALAYEAPVENTTTPITTVFTTIDSVTDPILKNLDIGMTADAGDITGELSSFDCEINTNLKTDDRAINALGRRTLTSQDFSVTSTMTTDLLYTSFNNYMTKAINNTAMDLQITLGSNITVDIEEFIPEAPTKAANSKEAIEVTIPGEGFSEATVGPISFAIDMA